MLYITIRKVQGENRQRGDDGKLRASQHAKFCFVLHDQERYPKAYGIAKSSMSAAKSEAEKLFGSIRWEGYPDYLGFEDVHAAAQIEN